MTTATFKRRVLDALQSSRATTIMAWLTAGCVLGVLLLGIVFGPQLISSTNAVENGTNLTGCRSSYSATVTDRRTEFDIARSERDTASTDLGLLTNEITQAAIFGDEATVDLLLPKLAPARALVTERQEAVVAADEALVEANDVYQAAVTLSRSDPDQFLERCKETDQ